MNKILLVDDDTATNFYNKYIISRHAPDYEIVMLNNGLEAFDYIKKDIPLPDMIFTDINMPVMDGIEFLEAAQDLFKEKLKNVKIFVMISVDLTDDKLQKLDAISDVEMIKGKMLTEEFIKTNIKNIDLV